MCDYQLISLYFVMADEAVHVKVYAYKRTTLAFKLKSIVVNLKVRMKTYS